MQNNTHELLSLPWRAETKQIFIILKQGLQNNASPGMAEIIRATRYLFYSKITVLRISCFTMAGQTERIMKNTY